MLAVYTYVHVIRVAISDAPISYEILPMLRLTDIDFLTQLRTYVYTHSYIDIERFAQY